MLVQDLRRYSSNPGKMCYVDHADYMGHTRQHELLVLLAVDLETDHTDQEYISPE